jgi:predicted secreted protein
MTMTRLAGAATILALLCLSLPAAAADAPVPEAVTVLHLSAEAERMVPRDRLRAELRVDGADADPARLQADINRRMAEAVARAKTAAGVSLATSGYSVFEEMAKDQPPRWHGTAGLTLTAQDAAPLLALVGELQQSGLALSALNYELSPEAARKVEDALTAEALSHLRARAARVAESLGLTVLRIRDLHLGNAAGTAPPPRPFMMARAVSSAAPPPVAEPGDATVSLSVDADVELGRK